MVVGPPLAEFHVFISPFVCLLSGKNNNSNICRGMWNPCTNTDESTNRRDTIKTIRDLSLVTNRCLNNFWNNFTADWTSWCRGNSVERRVCELGSAIKLIGGGGTTPRDFLQFNNCVVARKNRLINTNNVGSRVPLCVFF